MYFAPILLPNKVQLFEQTKQLDEDKSTVYFVVESSFSWGSTLLVVVVVVYL